MKLVGLTGKALAGKGETASVIGESNRLVLKAFADPLKEAAKILFGMTNDDVYTQAGKLRFNGVWGTTNRDLLQRLGTEAMRGEFGSDFWIKRMAMSIDSIKLRDWIEGVVIHDVRFDNEAEMIRDRGGVIIHIYRDAAGLQGEAGAHASEKGVTFKDCDHVLFNNGSLTELSQNANNLMRMIYGNV